MGASSFSVADAKTYILPKLEGAARAAVAAAITKAENTKSGQVALDAKYSGYIPKGSAAAAEALAASHSGSSSFVADKPNLQVAQAQAAKQLSEALRACGSEAVVKAGRPAASAPSGTPRGAEGHGTLTRKLTEVLANKPYIAVEFKQDPTPREKAAIRQLKESSPPSKLDIVMSIKDVPTTVLGLDDFPQKRVWIGC